VDTSYGWLSRPQAGPLPPLPRGRPGTQGTGSGQGRGRGRKPIMHEKPEQTPLGWPILPRHSKETQTCGSQPALGLRRIRLELPPGASRTPAGSPGAGPVGHADASSSVSLGISSEEDAAAKQRSERPQNSHLHAAYMNSVSRSQAIHSSCGWVSSCRWHSRHRRSQPAQ
jgi:hypothetical protein